jgi:hypothetical protein
MRQPKGFEVKGAKKQVCLLRKARYELKQAPHTWYLKIDSIFKEHGLICNDLNYNLYYNITNGHYVFCKCRLNP